MKKNQTQQEINQLKQWINNNSWQESYKKQYVKYQNKIEKTSMQALQNDEAFCVLHN